MITGFLDERGGRRPGERRHHHPDFEAMQARGWKAALKEAEILDSRWKAECEAAVNNGLAGADSIEDRSISTFARGELPITPESIPF